VRPCEVQLRLITSPTARVANFSREPDWREGKKGKEGGWKEREGKGSGRKGNGRGGYGRDRKHI